MLRPRELKAAFVENIRTNLQEIYRNKDTEKLEELFGLIIKELEDLHKDNKELKEKIKELERRVPEPNGK